MGSIGSVASLFATLGLDDAVFNTKLAAAETKLIAAADRMGVPIERISKFLEKIGSSTHVDEVVDQLNRLAAEGLSSTEALAAVTAGLERMAKEEDALARAGAETRAAIAAVEKKEIGEQLAARASVAKITSEVEKTASATRAAVLKADLTAAETAYAREQAAEAEAAAARTAIESKAAADRVALLNGVLIDAEATYSAEVAAEAAAAAARVAIEARAAADRAAILNATLIDAEATFTAEVAAEKAKNAAIIAAEKAAAAERAAIQRGITQGAYAAGGYSAGRATGAIFAGVSPGMVGAAVGAVATYELVKFSTASAEAARTTRNLAEQLNISWTQARNLEEGARIAGTSVGTLQQASGRLAEDLDSGTASSKLTIAALREMGVEGATSGEILLSFLDKLGQIADPTERIAKAREVLKRSSYEILPYITNLTEINRLQREMGTQTTPQMAAAAVKGSESLAALGVAWERLKDKIAGTIGLPAINWLERQVASLNAAMGTPPLRTIRHEGESMSPKDLAVMDEIERRRIERETRAQMALDAEAARQRRANHVATVEELREELAERKAAAIKLNTELNRTIMPLGPGTTPTRQAAESEYEKAAADVKRVQGEIDALTGKSEARTQAAQAHAYRAAVQAIRDEEEAAKSKLRIEYLLEDDIREADETGIQAATERRIKFNDAILAETIKANNRLLAEEKGRARDEKDLTLVGANEKAIAETTEANIRLRKEAASKILQLQIDDGKKESAERERQRKEDLQFEIQKTNDRVRAAQIRLRIEEDTAIKGIEIQKRIRAFEVEMGQITLAERIKQDIYAEGQELAIQRDAINKEIALLDDRQNRIGQTDEAIQAKKMELMKQLQAAEDAHQAKILGYLMEQLRGTTKVNQAIIEQTAEQNRLRREGSQQDALIALTNAEIRTKALTVTTQGLGKVYADMVKGVEHAWGQVGKTLAGGILNPENFTKDWKAALHSIEEELLGTFIQGLLDIGAAWVIQALKIGVASKGVAVSQVFDAAAVAYANTLASISMIPIIGPSIAPGIAEAMYTYTLGTSLPKLGTLDEGGKIPHDMLSVVHAGESYYTEAQTKRIESALSSGGGGGDTYDFRGASFGAGLSQPIVKAMMQSAIGDIRRKGGLATRNGRL